MDAPEILTEPVGPPDTNGQPAPELEPWKFNKNGQAYVPRGGGKAGIITRQGEETVAQARERDALPKGERRPRRKPKMPPKPAAPRKTDLKQLEYAIAEGLKAPGSICASFLEDDWPAEHFNAAGPYLARNLITAAEFNPWLKGVLEQAASGEEAMMKVLGMMMLSGALVMYFAPPTIYFLNLRVPDTVRTRLNVPPRREPDAAPEHQAGPAGHPAYAA